MNGQCVTIRTVINAGPGNELIEALPIGAAHGRNGTMGHPFSCEAFTAQPSADHAYTPNEYTPNAFTRTLTETDPPWPLTDSSSSSANGDCSGPGTNFELSERFIKHHEIIRKIGQGGMGSVFLARDRRLGRLVAVKFLHPGGQSPSRLLAEARATARARHENIVVIYDIGMFEGRPYMVLEYLSGQPLRDVLSEARGLAGRVLSRGFAINVVIAVVQALSAAHKSGVIHRDLKPENIMLLDSGQVKVLDFGIARRLEKGETEKPIGTFAYMSPEQWLGRDIDGRADIWAAGLLLFEVLSGAHPLAPLATRDLSIIANLELSMPSLRDVCPELGGLCDIVDRCLRKRKEERFESADELLQALETWRTRSEVSAANRYESPFAGLAAFQETDSERFFGRERDIAVLLGWLGRHALVAIAGASGAGKSSCIRAGVIPALRNSGETWDVICIRPGRSPLHALKEALTPEVVEGDWREEPGLFGTCLRSRCRAKGVTHRIAVFVDQFEELFTLVADPGERSAFLACLLGAADDASSPLRVIIAIRSDFLERVVDERLFLDRLRAGLYFLPPVDQHGLREALVQPIEVSGYRFEDDSMIRDMLGELAHTRCPLPLLQFSASALWEKRDTERKLITRQSYEKLGGVMGALSTYAEGVIAGLSTSEQRICRAIILRLITPERTRAIATLDELAIAGTDASRVEAVVQHLGAARLLLLDSGGERGTTNVELVHESLIERWPTLTRWLDESAGDAAFLARLRAAATQWQTEGEPSGLLWRDRAAEEAQAWYGRKESGNGDDLELLGERERRYLQAVISLHKSLRRKYQRVVALGFALVTFIAFVVSFLALQERAQAKRADEEAARVREQNARLALQAIEGRNAKRMLAARDKEDDPTLVLSILREVELPNVPKDWPELVSGALTSGVSKRVRSFGDAPVYMVEVSPDGQRIALAMGDNVVRILDADDFEEKVVLRGHELHVWAARWSKDGKRIVTASGDKTARVWNADGSGEAMVLHGHTAEVGSASFSPDEERIVTASEDKTVRVWNAHNGSELFVIRYDAVVTFAEYSKDGRRLFVATSKGMGYVLDTDRHTPLVNFRGHTKAINEAAWSPDGKRIVTASMDKTARVWDVANGNELVALRGHEEKVMSVAWSRDGKRIASTSTDKTVRIWNPDGHGEPLILRGHQHWVYSADFGPDNRSLFTSSLDRTVRSWDIEAIVAPLVLRGHEDFVSLLLFSPDGKRVATLSSDRSIRVWNVDGSGQPRVYRNEPAGFLSMCWSPDGTRILTASLDGKVRIWFVDGSKSSSAPIAPHIIEFPGHHGVIPYVSWSPDGQRIVTASREGIMQLWSPDGNNLATIERLAIDSNTTLVANFDPSGKIIAVHDSKHALVHLWFIDRPKEFVVLGNHEAGIGQIQWNPDGSQILTQSQGIIRVWDVHGGLLRATIREKSPITQADWSSDGGRILLTSAGGMMRIRNADGAGDPIVIGRKDLALSWLDWHPDGARFITGTVEGAAHVWNADGSGLPFVFRNSRARAGFVQASPSGTHFGIRTDERVARIWPAVRPFSGVDDERLWRATTYCIPFETRIELYGVTDTEARAQEEACRRRVANVAVGRLVR